MGIDAQLYLSPRWGVQEIKDVLLHHCGIEAKTKTYPNLPSMITFQAKDFYCSLHLGSSSPTGRVNVIITRPANYKIMKQIADVLGGWLCENDCEDVWTSHNGILYEEDGVESRRKWKERMKK